MADNRGVSLLPIMSHIKRQVNVHQQLTSPFQNFSFIVILSDQLLQLKRDPAALCVLLVALLACYGELIYHLMIDALAASPTVFFKGTRVKAKAFNAVPKEKLIATIT